MNRELEKKIDEIIKKSSVDIKNRICRVVTLHQNRVNKEYTKNLKNASKGLPVKQDRPSKPKNVSIKLSKSSSKSSRSSSRMPDSDDDSYSDYSE